MTKEEILECLKDSILTLLRKNKEIKENDILLKKWQENANRIDEGVKSLNSCDSLWLAEQYQKWLKENEEIQKGIKDRTEELEKTTEWI